MIPEDLDRLVTFVHGSKMYGLDTPESDTDLKVVYQSSTKDLLGWRKPPESYDSHEPQDVQAHEVEKFLRLVVKGNPTLLELLFAGPEHAVGQVDQRWVQIQGARACLVNARGIRASYGGFVKAQTRKMAALTAKSDAKREKNMRHAWRLVLQGQTLLIDGSFDPRLSDWQAKACRKFGVQAVEDPDRAIAVLNRELGFFDTIASPLPDEPDLDAADRLLRSLRDQRYY